MSERSEGGAMAHYRYRDDVAAYALGALDSTETLALERHLEECASCREYLGWLDPAVEMLPDSVPPLEPPRRLKRDLMSAVRADVKAHERAERAGSRGRRILGLTWGPATALAVCMLLVAGLVTGYALRGDDTAQSVLVEARPANPGVASGAMVATLEVAGERGTLHVERLPPLPGDRVYQAWIGRDGEMVPSTPFVVRADGANEVAIDGSLEGADGVFITREPEGGSTEPTPPVLMKAPLA